MTIEYRVTREIPGVLVGAVYRESGVSGFWFTASVPETHPLRSLPFWLLQYETGFFHPREIEST